MHWYQPFTMNFTDNNEEWAALRYGWYAGSDGFRDGLVRRLGKVMEGRQRGSYSGGGVRRHDESEAEKLIVKGMKALGVTEHDLSCLPKGHARTH